MVKNIFRLALIGILLVAVGGFVAGWWNGEVPAGTPGTVVGTTGVAQPVNMQRGSSEAILTDDSLAVLIKSRMVRDRDLAAEGIQVRLADGVVTLTGIVRSREQRERAVQIARETEGVENVIDRLDVQR